MRILHICKYYYPYIGGVENICKYIVDNTDKRHAVAVLCFDSGKKDMIDEVDGITVYRVGTKINIARQALSLSYFPMMKKVLREFQPDIIHFHWANPFPTAVLLSMIPKKMKLVVHWHMDIIKQFIIYPLIKPFETALLKRADLVVVTSPQYKEGSLPLQRFKSKVKILPNAIDENNLILRKDDEEMIECVKAKYGHKKIVFFVGRHIQYKGLPYLIEAEKQVRADCVFIIAGSGPLTEKLKAQCNSSRVYFVGRLSNDELRWYHYAASVFAFPSITKNEAFGVALAEAMYCETPTVVFTINGSGVNWVSLNGKTGIEVTNKNIKAYAKAIDKLLDNDSLRIKMGINAKARVKAHFTIPIMCKTMNDFYLEMFSNNCMLP